MTFGWNLLKKVVVNPTSRLLWCWVQLQLQPAPGLHAVAVLRESTRRKETNDARQTMLLWSQSWMKNVTKILQQGDKMFVFHLNHKLPQKSFQGPSKISPSIEFFILTNIFTSWQSYMFQNFFLCEEPAKNQQNSHAQNYISTYLFFCVLVSAGGGLNWKKHLSTTVVCLQYVHKVPALLAPLRLDVDMIAWDLATKHTHTKSSLLFSSRHGQIFPPSLPHFSTTAFAFSLH